MNSKQIDNFLYFWIGLLTYVVIFMFIALTVLKNMELEERIQRLEEARP